ncbi:MAG TPA: histidine triad nucleotide-binding protein [Acidimicrobiia bacterium]|nr:histidine triad nucleotide-binding protein [Acidimicrobiia bacterium]
MRDCVFCKIVAGEIPSSKVAETDRIYAFRDIEPHAPTHVLLVPKEHVLDSVADLGADDADWLAELMVLAAEVAREEGLEDGWRIVTNVGPAAGQTVFHVHFHLMGGWSDR